MNFIQNKLKQNVAERSSSRPTDTSTEVPVKAGSQLLSRFQEDWIQIHACAISCSKKAKDMNYSLEKVAADIKDKEENFRKLQVQLQAIPSMLTQADELALALEKLETTVVEVSCALDFYEKISHEHELCNRRQAVLREVNRFRISKREELEKAKEQLAKKHSQHLAQIISQQENLAVERQKTLLDAIGTSET